MSTITLNKNASVVDYNFARIVLVGLGYDLFRANDSQLKVMEGEGTGWRQPKNDDDYIGILTVDVGLYSDVLANDGKLCFSKPGQELVDFCSFLQFIVKKLKPDFKPTSSPYIGHGRSQQHYIEQYVAVLTNIEDTVIV